MPKSQIIAPPTETPLIRLNPGSRRPIWSKKWFGGGGRGGGQLSLIETGEAIVPLKNNISKSFFQKMFITSIQILYVYLQINERVRDLNVNDQGKLEEQNNNVFEIAQERDMNYQVRIDKNSKHSEDQKALTRKSSFSLVFGSDGPPRLVYDPAFSDQKTVESFSLPESNNFDF